MIGLDGVITIRRARFRSSQTGRMAFPLDEVLDLPGGEVTVSLARRALRLGTMMSLVELQDELREQHDARVSDSTLDVLMQKAGGVSVSDRQTRLDQLGDKPRGMYREQLVQLRQPAPARLYVSCDGITYRTCYREDDPQRPGQKRVIYQEMKVGTVFWQDARECWHKKVVAGRENPERFGLSLWEAAVECGMLEAGEVVFISDGGTWVNTVAQMYFQDACRILDWYHLSEHIWATGRELYPEDEKRAATWVESCLSHVEDLGGRGLCKHLERSRKVRRADDGQTLGELLDYVHPREGITAYAKYRAAGMVIGSGMMESTCKQVVGRRLKGAGMLWSEAGALAMTALVAHRLNGTWASFWNGRPLQRAA